MQKYDTAFFVDDGDFRLHCWMNNDYPVVVITDKEYPESVALRILEKIVKQRSFITAEELGVIFKHYTNPLNDKLYKIKQDLEETKTVLHSNIEKLFRRGEQLEDIIEKTDQLSLETKTFFKRAKKTNRWCPFLFWWL